MYQRRRARVLLALLVLATLVLITVDFRSGAEGPLDRLRAVATSVFAPVQDGLATVIRPVGDAVSSVSDVFSLRAENARLRDRLDELEERRRSFTDLERENERLRELLDIQGRTGLDSVAARVVGWSGSNYEWTVTIDAGRGRGVERNMVVINEDGLVGRVIQTTPNASRVLLAIDPNFSAASRAAESGENGSIDGRGGRSMRFQPLNPEASIEVGDEVVTSSYSNGVFPPGIPIGSVEEVGERTTLLEREVHVRPYVDFTRLDVVLVVQSSPVQDLPPLEPPSDVPFEPPRPASPSPSPGGESGDGEPAPPEGGDADEQQAAP